MFRFIAQLQRRPERERRIIALIVSASITGVIITLWFMGISLYPASQEIMDNEHGPLDSLGESVTTVFDDTAGIFDEIRQMFRGTPEVFTPLERTDSVGG